MIEKNLNKLKKPCKMVKSLDESVIITNRLFEILSNTKNGVGLAANQIGIDKRVCVINVSRPIALVNPEIIEFDGRIIFEEACLSFPGEVVITERYRNITVVASNLAEPLCFGGSTDFLECVCVQHEIDHLNGITMHDRAVDRVDIMGVGVF